MPPRMLAFRAKEALPRAIARALPPSFHAGRHQIRHDSNQSADAQKKKGKDDKKKKGKGDKKKGASSTFRRSHSPTPPGQQRVYDFRGKREPNQANRLSFDDSIRHPDHSHYWLRNTKSDQGYLEFHHTTGDGNVEVGQPPSKGFPVIRHWLRDACACEHCVDPSSGQKTFSTADVPNRLPIKEAVMNGDGDLEVTWDNDFLTKDSHKSTYSPDVMAQAVRQEPKQRYTFWDDRILQDRAPFYEYDSFMERGDEWKKAVATLQEYGIIFLTGMPHAEHAVEDVAATVGYIQETFYGRTWDVKSKPAAENVAYTNSYLGLHQDLLYMRMVPRIQILHCLENTCEGGESIFSDGMRAYASFSTLAPTLRQALTSYPIWYHYEKNGHSYECARFLLKDGMVNWSPPFQRPAQLYRPYKPVQNHAIFLRAMRLLKKSLETPEHVYTYKMKPGECVLFDNRRVLHGRNEFDTSSGSRWLKGTYVENSSYMSTLRTTFPEKYRHEPDSGSAFL